MGERQQVIDFGEGRMISYRKLQAMSMRDCGWTFQKIGDAMGVSRACARQMVVTGRRISRKNNRLLEYVDGFSLLAHGNPYSLHAGELYVEILASREEGDAKFKANNPNLLEELALLNRRMMGFYKS